MASYSLLGIYKTYHQWGRCSKYPTRKTLAEHSTALESWQYIGEAELLTVFIRVNVT